jgi:hypothetical protein
VAAQEGGHPRALCMAGLLGGRRRSQAASCKCVPCAPSAYTIDAIHLSTPVCCECSDNADTEHVKAVQRLGQEWQCKKEGIPGLHAVLGWMEEGAVRERDDSNVWPGFWCFVRFGILTLVHWN